MQPVKTVTDDINEAIRSAKWSTDHLTKAVDAINYIGSQGLLSLRQQRYLLLSAADQTANEVRDAHDQIRKITADWEHQHGAAGFAEFDHHDDDTFTTTSRYNQVAD